MPGLAPGRPGLALGKPGLAPEMFGLALERPRQALERPGLAPEGTGLAPERLRLAPKKPVVALVRVFMGRQMDKRPAGRMDVQIPPVFYRTSSPPVPSGAAALLTS